MVDTVDEVSADLFGIELPTFTPDTSLDNMKRFGAHVGWGSGRFTDHEAARKEGFPGAIVPGVLSQGFLGAMIHRWAPKAQIVNIDTISAHQFLWINPRSRVRVTNVEEDENLIEIDITVMNEAEETRVFGTATIKL